MFLGANTVAGQVSIPKVVVRVYDRSQTGGGVISETERAASAIFQQAGIDVAWLNCPNGTAECVEPPTSTNLILTVVKRGSAQMGDSDTMGLAVQDERGDGRYCYVFAEQLGEIGAQMHVSPSRLLAAVMAHELGHLLKGSHSHTPDGIMAAHWSRRELEEAARSGLTFNGQDATQMKLRLEKSEPELRAAR